MKNKLEVAMNKLALGVVALAFLVGFAFADYTIVKLDGTGVWNPKTVYDPTNENKDGYMSVYGTGELLPGNAKDADGYYVTFKDGYAVIDPIVQKGTTAPNTWDGVALSIRNRAETASPNIGDCSGGFKYEYKGAKHNFELAFDPSLCGGSNPDEGSNKWGKKDVAASTGWATSTITFANLQTNGLINTWTGATAADASKCQPTTAAALPTTSNLKKVFQMSWVVDGGADAIGKTLSIGTVTCIGGTLPSSSSISSSSVAASSSSRASSSSASGSSSSVSGSSSSGGSSSGSSSSVSGSSSSSEDPEPIISYNKAPVAGLNVVSFARNLQIASAKDATVALFDMHGRQVFSQKVFSGTTTLSLANQRQGVYYAVVKSGSHKQTVKVVLK